MEKIKKLIFDNKNIINIGLIGSLILFISRLLFDYASGELTLFTIILPLPLLMYFFAIKLRLKGKNIDIKILQNVLLICSFLRFILPVYIGGGRLGILTILESIYSIMIIIYMFNIFYSKGISINNNLYIIISIIYLILGLFFIISKLRIFSLYFFWELLFMIGNILIGLYFYNYYNLLKGAKNNG